MKAKKEGRFRRWRKSKGLSLDMIARESGVNYLTLCRLDSMPDRRPRRMNASALGTAYPDCPLALNDRAD
jgi:transcriptional regulator with XRE-family HTH domain